MTKWSNEQIRVLLHLKSLSAALMEVDATLLETESKLAKYSKACASAIAEGRPHDEKLQRQWDEVAAKAAVLRKEIDGIFAQGLELIPTSTAH